MAALGALSPYSVKPGPYARQGYVETVLSPYSEKHRRYAPEGYVNKIFRLLFKMDAKFLLKRNPEQISRDVTRALNVFRQLKINPHDKGQVLEEIRRNVQARGLEQDMAFNRRINEMNMVDPLDHIAEKVEEDTGYVNPVTREMKDATTEWINATVENQCMNSSSEYDSEEDGDYQEVMRAIEKIRTLPKERVCVSEKNIDFMRYEILKNIVMGRELVGILSPRFKIDISRLLRSRRAGGTKHKSKKKKRTKRKLK